MPPEIRSAFDQFQKESPECYQKLPIKWASSGELRFGDHPQVKPYAGYPGMDMLNRVSLIKVLTQALDNDSCKIAGSKFLEHLEREFPDTFDDEVWASAAFRAKGQVSDIFVWDSFTFETPQTTRNAVRKLLTPKLYDAYVQTLLENDPNGPSFSCQASLKQRTQTPQRIFAPSHDRTDATSVY